MQPAFRNDFLNDPNNPAAIDVYKNALLHGWNAKAPLFFCGGSRDPVVGFYNAREAYAYFKNRGANVTLVNVDPYIPKGLKLTLYHVAVLIFCEPLARKTFFDPRR